MLVSPFLGMDLGRGLTRLMPALRGAEMSKEPWMLLCIIPLSLVSILNLSKTVWKSALLNACKVDRDLLVEGIIVKVQKHYVWL